MSFNNKFGVLIDKGGKYGFEDSPVLMPKQKWKYRALFTGFGRTLEQNDLSQNLTNITRPSINFNPVEVHSGNSIAYIPGKHMWNPITMTLRDEVNNDVSTLIGGQIQKQVDLQNQTSPLSAHEVKFTTEIVVISGTGEPLEVFCLRGCFLESAEPTDLDYSSSEFLTWNLGVKFDAGYLGDGKFEGNADKLHLANLTPGFREAIYSLNG